MRWRREANSRWLRPPCIARCRRWRILFASRRRPWASRCGMLPRWVPGRVWVSAGVEARADVVRRAPEAVGLALRDVAALDAALDLVLGAIEVADQLIDGLPAGIVLTVAAAVVVVTAIVGTLVVTLVVAAMLGGSRGSERHGSGRCKGGDEELTHGTSPLRNRAFRLRPGECYGPERSRQPRFSCDEVSGCSGRPCD